MIARRLLPLLLAAVATGAFAGSALASAAPSWSIRSLATPTNFIPGDEAKDYFYEVTAANNGAAPTDASAGAITITDTLPAGLGVKDVELFVRAGEVDLAAPAVCETDVVGEVSTVTCTLTEALVGEKEPAKIWPSEVIRLVVHVSTPSSKSGLLENHAEVEGGGAALVSVDSTNNASPEPAGSGFSEFRAELTGEEGESVGQASAHPYEYTTTFGANTVAAPPGAPAPLIPAGGDLREIEVRLPPGFVGNPTVASQCTAQRFSTIRVIGFEGNNIFANLCPESSAVGIVVLQQVEGIGTALPVPLYNLVPPKGMPAQLGFQIAGAPTYINTRLRSDSDYGISAFIENTSEAKRVTAASVTIWGTPADPSHDRLRGHCLNTLRSFSTGSCPASIADPRPFFRLPTSCAFALPTTMSFDTWTQPGILHSSTDTDPAPTACDQPDFTPTIEARPSTNVADSPSGLHVDLHLPQKANEDPEGLSEADLEDATVTLPPGLSVNPASADGLGACSLAQIGYQGIREGKPSFSTEPAQCPDAAKIGTVEIDTPLVDHPIPGSIYLAKQFENPSNSLLALYIAVNDPETGVVIKLPGKVETNPLTGQITNTFEQNPQLPFEDLKVDLFQGARAPLRTPATCGKSATEPHVTTTTLVPHSAPEGATAHPTDSFQIAQAPSGGPCATTQAQLPNAPSFEAGTQNPLAGAYSPFLLRLKREDGSQELKGLNVTLPPGLVARLAGTAECSAAGVAQAQSRTNPGQGALEQVNPSCPASSQLGTVTVGAGAGPSPFYAQGKAYLAGPYKGAPLSMLILTPAVAGPFDLGSVAVRAALNVDPETTKVTVVSDPIPTILQGIPLDVRSIAVKVDKPDFTLNPTSCEAKSLTAEAISVSGNVANLNNRFQVGGCSNLGFKPSLALKLKGGTKRGDHPALTATLTYPKSGAYSNIAKAQVALPHSEFLDTTHIKTICTRVQFAASQCPRGAIYGFAKAITPLLDKPLEGPVYLRSSSNPLPDLVADLNGQIHVVLAGRVDSIRGGTRNTFQAVPDAPVSKFTLSLPAGKKGLLQNSTNICQGSHKATADFTAHNGKTLRLKPELEAKCKGKAKKRGKPRRKHG